MISRIGFERLGISGIMFFFDFVEDMCFGRALSLKGVNAEVTTVRCDFSREFGGYIIGATRL